MNRNLQIVYKKDNGSDEKTYYIDKHEEWLPQEFELDMILVQEQTDEREREFVEVVRCGDCVFFQYTAGTPWCNWWRDVIGLLDYCSNGKGGHADG